MTTLDDGQQANDQQQAEARADFIQWWEYVKNQDGREVESIAGWQPSSIDNLVSQWKRSGESIEEFIRDAQLTLIATSEHDSLLDKEVEQIARRRKALEIVREREVLAAWSPPERYGTLDVELELPDEPYEMTIDQLAGRGHNVLMTGMFKVGKTVFAGNVTRALVDGTDLFGSFPVRRLSGRVAYLNYELDVGDFRALARSLSIRNTERVCALHLRGHRMPLNVEQIEQWFIDFLRTNDVEVVIADPWNKVMSGAGSENDNDDVSRVTEALDVIKKEAGVVDLFVNAHGGRAVAEEGAEHARGATRLDDWADVRWLYTRDAEGRRYFACPEGRRGVYLAETQLSFDPDTATLIVAGGSRAATRYTEGITEVVRVVRAQPDLSGKAIKEQMRTTSHAQQTRALDQATRDGFVVWHPGPRGAHLYRETAQGAALVIPEREQ
jgi:hypothetical protein